MEGREEGRKEGRKEGRTPVRPNQKRARKGHPIAIKPPAGLQ